MCSAFLGGGAGSFHLWRAGARTELIRVLDNLGKVYKIRFRMFNNQWDYFGCDFGKIFYGLNGVSILFFELFLRYVIQVSKAVKKTTTTTAVSQSALQGLACQSWNS